MVEPGPTVEGDDPAIPDDETLLRRLSDAGPNMVAVDPLTGVRRPSSGAFKPDPDVSVYRTSVLASHGLDAQALVKAPHNLVVSIEVSDVRRHAGLGVRADPWPQDIEDPRHLRNAAHALIIGWSGLSKNQRRERQRALATAPSLRFVIG
jgi:hypothetical protein